MLPVTCSTRFATNQASLQISKSIAYGDCPVSFAKRVGSAPLKEIGVITIRVFPAIDARTDCIFEQSKMANTNSNSKRKMEIAAEKVAIKEREREDSPQLHAPQLQEAGEDPIQILSAPPEPTAPAAFPFPFSDLFGGGEFDGFDFFGHNIDVSHMMH
jgi:hypothetical protein